MGTQEVEVTLDQDFIFRLTSEQVTVTQDGHHVSVDEGFQPSWISPEISQIVKEKLSVPGYKNTYDCNISDFHRIMKKVAFFLALCQTVSQWTVLHPLPSDTARFCVGKSWGPGIQRFCANTGLEAKKSQQHLPSIHG